MSRAKERPLDAVNVRVRHQDRVDERYVQRSAGECGCDRTGRREVVDLDLEPGFLKETRFRRIEGLEVGVALRR